MICHHRGSRRIGARASLGLAPLKPRTHWCGSYFGLGLARLQPKSCGGLFVFGTTGPPATLVQELFRFGTIHDPSALRITEATAEWACGSPSLWNHGVSRRSCATTSFAVGSSRPPLHGLGGLLCLGTTKYSIRLVRGLLCVWNQLGPYCMAAGASAALGQRRLRPHWRGASFALVASRPLPHGRECLLRFGSTKAPAARAWGLLRLRPRRLPPFRRSGAAVSVAMASSSPPPTWARRPPLLRDH